MPLPAPTVRSNRLTLTLLWIAFYATFALVTPPLLDDADSVHAEVSREMLLRHDYVTLYANGIRYLEKAPLLYWSMAASMKLFGPHPAAARLPLALSVLALALTLELFARRAFSSARAGLYAGLLLLSSFGIFIFTRINIPDLMVCLWLTVALFSFWITEQSPGLLHLQPAPPRYLPWTFAAACALDVLTKGLIGIVFPVGIVLAYLLLTRGVAGTLRRLRQLHLASSLLLFLALAAPWHLLAGLANPTQGHPGGLSFTHGHWQVPLPTDGNVHGWFWFYFVNEHLLRYLNLRVPRDYDTVPLGLFWGLLLVWLMPWSAFLWQALRAVEFRATLVASPLFKHLSWLQKGWVQSRLNPTGQIALLTAGERTRLLLAIWAALPLLFFSLSTRQEYYVLPSLPPLLLLIAAALNDEVDEAAAFITPATHVLRSGAKGLGIATLLLVLGSLAALVCGYFLLHAATPSPSTDLASLLQQNPGDYALSFGHFLDLNAAAMGAFRTPLLLTAVSLFLASLFNWLAREDYRPALGNLALAAGTFGFLVAAHLGLQTFAPVLSSYTLAQAIAPQLLDSDLLVINGEYESGSTLGFYLHRDDIHILNGRSSNLWYGSFFPDAPPRFEDNTSIARLWQGHRRVFLWTEPDHLPDLPGKTFLIAHSGGKEILSNQPNP